MSRSVKVPRRVVLGGCAAALSVAGLVSFVSAPASATSSASVADFPLRPNYYGENYDLQNARRFRADHHVDAQIAALHPTSIRWPGGTEADFYNWRTGKGRSSGNFVFTLKDLAGAVSASHAAPMFDLNVLADRAHPRKQLADQLAMLKEAHDRYHLQVKYVELGNELYFDGPKLPNAPQGAFRKGFPTGTSYGTTVAMYVTALHHAFPGVRVGADAILHPAKNNSREDNWNKQLLGAATGAGAPDVVILHDYPGPNIRDLTGANLAKLFTGPYSAVQQIQTTARALGKPAWLTEFNLAPWINHKHKTTTPPANPVQLTYAHELYIAEMATLLPREPDIARVDNYGAFGNTGILGAWADPKRGGVLTPYGQAVQFVDTAGHDATSTAQIAIPGAPTVHAGDAAVLGQAFFGAPSGPRAVLVNLTGSARTVPLQPGIAAGTAYEYVSGNPTAQQTVAGKIRTGTIQPGGLTLASYSVTLVG